MTQVLLVVLTVVLTLVCERVAPTWWNRWRESRRTKRARASDQAVTDAKFGHLYGNKYVLVVDGQEIEVELLGLFGSYRQAHFKRTNGEPFPDGELIWYDPVPLMHLEPEEWAKANQQPVINTAWKVEPPPAGGC